MNERMSIELWSKRSRRWKILSNWQRGECMSISERKTYWCTRSVLQSWRNRVQRTTRFPSGIRRWFHDSSAQQKIGHEMRVYLGSEVNWYGRKQLILCLHRRQHLQFLFEQRSEVRNQYCEQFSAAGKRVWQSSALVSPTKTLNTDLAPIGDDIEPIKAPREDVEMGNDEDEEPSEAEVIRARIYPKNPTSREKQEHEDSGRAVYSSVFAACVQGRGNIELNCWRKRSEKERLPVLPLTTVA